MKLYEKKLNSLSALKSEQHKIRKTLRKSDKNPPAQQAVNTPTPATAKANIASSLLGLVTEGGLLASILPFAGNMAKNIFLGKKIKKVGGNILKDIAITYATGKATMLAVNGIQYLIKKQKEKKAVKKLLALEAEVDRYQALLNEVKRTKMKR